jgi:predicted nucleotidyltransferase
VALADSVAAVPVAAGLVEVGSERGSKMVPEKTINDFVTRLRQAAGANLESVILFGSAVAGDFHPEFSNVNLFCVIRDSSFAALQAIGPAVKWWDAQKQPSPLFMTRHEIERSVDVFTIELIDIRQHHRVLFGEDVIEGLSIPANLHRVQVEYELREKLALLRQHLLLASGNEPRMWELLLRSVSSFSTLFRHALMVLGREAPVGKRAAVQELSKQLGFDPSGILQVLDVREKKSHRKTFVLTDVFARYLAAVEQVAAAVDRMLDSGATGSR